MRCPICKRKMKKIKYSEIETHIEEKHKGFNIMKYLKIPMKKYICFNCDLTYIKYKGSWRNNK